MDIMELGAIGELVGGVAVIATLIYLAAQIRYTKSEVTHVRTQNAMAAYVRWYELLLEPETAQLWNAGIHGYGSLSRQDQLRFHSLLLQAFVTYVQSVQANAEGMYAADLFDPQERWFAAVFNTAGGGAWWEATKSDWPPEIVERFRHRYDRFAEGHPMVPPDVYTAQA